MSERITWGSGRKRDDVVVTTPRRLIGRNMIQCNECGDVIESLARWHCVWCSCASVAVDGGRAYLRRVFMHEATFTEMSTYVDEGQPQ